MAPGILEVCDSVKNSHRPVRSTWELSTEIGLNMFGIRDSWASVLASGTVEDQCLEMSKPVLSCFALRILKVCNRVKDNGRPVQCNELEKCPKGPKLVFILGILEICKHVRHSGRVSLEAQICLILVGNGYSWKFQRRRKRRS